jgi:CRP-like cAMP-binding protein
LRKDAKIELIRKVPLFAHCSKAEIAQIASLADELRLPEGTALIREGERGREFFVIVAGAVDVKKKGRKVASMGPGDFAGEIALISDVPRTATVTASTEVDVLVLTDRGFRALVERSPSIQAKVLRALADRVAPQAI